MVHLPALITDLGLILCAASVVLILFKKLKQPLVLGYIIAGLIVSPNFKLFPSIVDTHNIEVWAEIGVIFLLFSLGLEFSFKKLVKVGGTSSITAFVQIMFMIVAGYFTGRALNWSQMDSIFLGAMLSMSSTTIILRAFDELNVKNKKFAGIVFGALIVEDLVAIVLMVLLSTIAVSQQFAGMDMAFSIAKLAFFLILWFVAGIFFIPTVLKKARPHLNDETMLIISLGLCFLMVILASKAGFSPALGAFIMGSILAETTQGERIEHLIKPVKELFGAIFFVSVGILINLQTLQDYALPILVITLVTVIGKTFSTSLGALISGQPLTQSVQAGMSLAQIGEFSFIIASLGISLNVTSGFLYPVIVAVSGVTTFTTPYLIKASTPAHNWLQQKLPIRLTNSIERYSSDVMAIKTASDWNVILKSYLFQLIIFSVIAIGALLVLNNYVFPSVMNSAYWVRIGTVLASLLVMSPFIWAIAIKKIQPEATARLWSARKYKGPLLMLQVIRLFAALFIVVAVVSGLLSSYLAVAMLILVAVIVVAFHRKMESVYDRIESRFISNFNEKENQAEQDSRKHLVPWDAHISSFTISPEYVGIGKPLLELQLRETLGVNIVLIERGTKVVNLPDRYEQLYPNDEVYVIGTDDQLESFRKYLDEKTVATQQQQSKQDISLELLEVKDTSDFAGKSIKESAIRERTKGLIVGLERAGERILNPDSNVVLQPFDLLWVVGNKKRISILAGLGHV
ncbi:MAG: sodium:proton antiporter [Sphingobacteriales bacterium]|nr:MAG: sodium:proton antiporter [Sphingobacteriales bacterium]